MYKFAVDELIGDINITHEEPEKLFRTRLIIKKNRIMKTNLWFRLNRTLYFGETKIPAGNYPLLQEKQSTLYIDKKMDM